MVIQTKQPLTATPAEPVPGIENVETLAEWQGLTDRTWDLARQKAAKKLPMYVSYYGYSMRYWPHDGAVEVQLTPDVAGVMRAAEPQAMLNDFIALDKITAEALEIPYSELMKELAA